MSRPTLKEVYDLLKPKSAQWNKIGEELGVSFNDRDDLLSDITRRKENKLEAVLNIWIESKCSEVSWSHLHCILQDELCYTEIAEAVERKFLPSHQKGTKLN